MTEYSSIDSELNRLSENISNTYDSLEGLGATMPQTRDSNNLSNTVQTLQNTILVNYIPANTILKVELDGSGDFTKLSDAVNYLTGKWSNGEVTIQLGSGTFTETSKIGIYGSRFLLPKILIAGKGISNTVVEWSTSADYQMYMENADVNIHNIAFTRPAKSDSLRGVISSVNNHLRVDQIKCSNSTYALAAWHSGNLYIGSSTTVENATAGIVAEIGGHVTSAWRCPIIFKNCSTAFYLSVVGHISMGDVQVTYTNVTRHTNGTVGSATSVGYISGI